MKIICWNVNGIRSLLKTDYLNNFIKNENPDILCMGETKIGCSYIEQDTMMFNIMPQFKFRYWSPCQTKKGYSGTSIFCKSKPLNITYGLDFRGKSVDDEGRIITIELKKFYLIHVYTPNSGQALARLEWRTTIWDRAFEIYIQKLQKIKPVIVCGDLNVSHKPIDLARPKTNLRTAGYTKEERDSFERLLINTQLIDTYRKLHPDKIEYSYWSYMRNSREKNIGWRLDYFLVDMRLIKKVKESIILADIMGSDHAPIKLEIKT
jgi:exodeoxyribonuclease III